MPARKTKRASKNSDSGVISKNENIEKTPDNETKKEKPKIEDIYHR